MTTIGGPGGIHGPKGPTGPDGAPAIDDASDVGRAADVGEVANIGGVRELGDIQALTAEIAAGRLTPREAIDRMVDRMVATTAGPGLGAAERADLRELLTDLVANDPVLGALIGRI